MSNDDIKNMAIIPPHKWPEGATPDEKLYSLEASRAAELHWDADTGEFVEAFVEPDRDEKPDYAPFVGTYSEVSARAVSVNRVQLLSGFIAWIFTPALIEPMGIA